ncbi:sarcosine oxidase subunit gamma family protein [Spirillospora sp. NPDC047279]|uniref:sarcosine oxidase subunit gamma n=1 Tax=Spirillospora sp. NPDC047279 TaxID=3155478 RepID=UPI00340FAF30
MTARSAIEHLSGALARTGGPARLHELPFPSQVELRLDDEDADSFGPRVGQFLSCDIPAAARATGGGDPYVLWLGPGWYLIVDRPGRAPGLLSGLHGALGGDCGGTCGSAVDVSAARTVLELTGPAVRAVLNHGCALDLHPRAFKPGDCAQTLLAQAQVILHQTAPHDYRLFVRTSYADYLARWLLDAMSEYQAAFS